MSVNTQSLVRDKDNVPVSQYYNVSTDTFEALTGRDGRMEIYTDKITEIVNAATTTTKTYASPQRSMLIANNGTTAITLTINDMNLPINPGEVYDEQWPAFTQFTVTGNSAFIAIVRG